MSDRHPKSADAAPSAAQSEREVYAKWRAYSDAAQALMTQQKWEEALVPAHAAARIAETLATTWQRSTAAMLFELADWQGHAHLMSLSERQKYPAGPPEWDGNAMDGTLVIVERDEHAGRPLRFGRLIPLAAERVRKCIALVDPRLVPLFARSFPSVDVRISGPGDADVWSTADALAGYHTLIDRVGGGEAGIRDSFRPLIPDPGHVEALRQRYGPSGRKRIGISWSSTNERKVVPRLDEWADFLRSIDATFVSLQYGDVGEEVKSIRALSGCDVIYDPAVDSLADLDFYAAQTAAMDAVVTISSTCAHMAGALGTPTVVLMDDSPRPGWPHRGETSPWYPSVTLVRHRGRDWPSVFAEMRRALELRLPS